MCDALTCCEPPLLPPSYLCSIRTVLITASISQLLQPEICFRLFLVRCSKSAGVRGVTEPCVHTRHVLM